MNPIDWAWIGELCASFACNHLKPGSSIECGMCCCFFFWIHHFSKSYSNQIDYIESKQPTTFVRTNARTHTTHSHIYILQTMLTPFVKTRIEFVRSKNRSIIILQIKSTKPTEKKKKQQPIIERLLGWVRKKQSERETTMILCRHGCFFYSSSQPLYLH